MGFSRSGLCSPPSRVFVCLPGRARIFGIWSVRVMPTPKNRYGAKARQRRIPMAGRKKLFCRIILHQHPARNGVCELQGPPPPP